MAWYTVSTVLVPGPTCFASPMISGRGITLKKWRARGGFFPSSRSASASTRAMTPTVTGLPQSGHRPFAPIVSLGCILLSHFLCPS